MEAACIYSKVFPRAHNFHTSYMLQMLAKAGKSRVPFFLQLIKFAHTAVLAYYCCMITVSGLIIM